MFKRSGDRLIAVPYRRPRILAVYVRQILEATEEDDE